MRRLALLLTLLLLLTAVPLTAQPAEPIPDTLAALAAAEAPARDRVELARRVIGLVEDPPASLVYAETGLSPERFMLAAAKPSVRSGGGEGFSAAPSAPPDWQPGDVLRFNVTNEAQNRRFEVEASLRVGGEHVWLWVERGVDIDLTNLRALAELFDEQVYGPLRALFGSENRPGVDGDPRVYVLFARGLGPRVAGYFSSEHSWPRAAVPTSNQREMVIFNLDVLGTDIHAGALAGLASHEFQHMIQAQQDPNESVWLNEGFSGFAELYTGFSFGAEAEARAFLAQPGTQLNTWPESGNTFPHYGAGLLFVTYLHDRFGADFLRQLSQHPAPALEALDSLLVGRGEEGTETFAGASINTETIFADWVMANLLQDAQLAEGRYGYRSLLPLRPPALAATVATYPFTRSARLAQYATDYLRLDNLQGAQSVEIALELPAQAQLTAATPASGRRLWYSNRQDNSDTTLTRHFDLRDLSGATLHFSLWYHMEELWDYGHVLLSADGGQRWQVLQSPAMTSANPHGNAIGPGYTGRSDGWLRELIPLDAWAGQELLLRFELLTDDAITQPGMLVDDVRIPELDYHSDFEKDDGGWQARGWVWSDNYVPQRMWLQAIQRGAGEPQLQRWLVTGPGVWTLALQPETTQVTLALSPMAELTTEALDYALQLTLK